MPGSRVPGFETFIGDSTFIAPAPAKPSITARPSPPTLIEVPNPPQHPENTTQSTAGEPNKAPIAGEPFSSERPRTPVNAHGHTDRFSKGFSEPSRPPTDTRFSIAWKKPGVQFS